MEGAQKRRRQAGREIAYALSPQETRLNTQFLLKQNVDFQSVKGVLQLWYPSIFKAAVCEVSLNSFKDKNRL